MTGNVKSGVIVAVIVLRKIQEESAMDGIEIRSFWGCCFMLFCMYHMPKDIESLIIFSFLLSMAVKSKDSPGDIESLLRE